MSKKEVELKVKIKGASPLIMHNSASANPQNEFTKLAKPIKSKGSRKTEEDDRELQELSFKASLYWSDELKSLYMPVENIQKMMLEAGRSLNPRGAKKQFPGIRFDTYLGWPLDVKNAKNYNGLVDDPSLRYFKIVTVNRAKVGSTRAIFKEWGFEFNVFADLNILDVKTVKDWLDYAGDRVGLGARRPYAPTPGQFGRFIVEEFAEVV